MCSKVRNPAAQVAKTDEVVTIHSMTPDGRQWEVVYRVDDRVIVR